MEPFTLGLIATGLSKVVPMAARWIGGDKAGKAAEKVVEIAQGVTGTSDGHDALAAIKKDPALALEFQKALLVNEQKLDALFLADKQDARKRDVELRKLGYTNKRADLMVLGDVIGLLACLGAMVAITIYGMNNDNAAMMSLLGPIGTLAGFFGAGLRDAHQFEFGSSRGSKEKDLTLAFTKGPPHG